MKPVTIFLLTLFSSISFSRCDGSDIEKPEKKEPVLIALLDVDERLKAADSLVVVFYKDPYGADSLRYTRYYTQVSIVGSDAIALLQQQLKEKAEKLEEYRKCRGGGKIWCYWKGKIFQTVYFSNRCDDCCHVYIIKDGFYYYTSILQSFVTWLESAKVLSEEPPNNAPSSINE